MTLEPVYVTGERESGAQALVRRHDAQASACRNEIGRAVASCTVAAGTAVNAALSAPTGIGLVVNGALTVAAGVLCAADIVAARDCKEQAAARAEADAECTAQGGVLLSGGNGGLVCLRTQ